MKYVQKTSKNITNNFLMNLFIDRGLIPENDIEYQKQYFNPTKQNLLDYRLLDNIEEGAELLEKHIKNGGSIYIAVDPDIDGFSSAAVIYNYIENNYKSIYTNFTIDYHIPDGKEHGLDTLMKDLGSKKKYDLILLPDSSSNDYEHHKQLKKLGYDILVLDHHEADKYSEDAVVINNQLSEKYSNKALSGVGVVYKFLQFLDEKNGFNDADNYLDLVAAGECGDMMDLNTLENRYISNYGFSHIKNEGLRQLIKLQAYSIFGKYPADISNEYLDNSVISPINIAFYIAPLVNALIRFGSYSEKEILFKSFIKGKEMIPSTKRGHKGEFETIAEQSARNCCNARTRQNKEKDKALDLLDIQIFNNSLDDNKIIILNADGLETPNTLTGLCAMGVSAKYKKPVLLGRTTPDNLYLKGSMRGVNGSELQDFKAFLTNSKYFEYVEGHANAAGFSIKISNIDKLCQYANESLKDINFNEGFYEADFIVDSNCSYLSDMVIDLDKGKYIYGQNCPEPVIIIKNITLDKSNIQIIGSNKDTLKFTFNNMTYIKFKAKDLIEKINYYNNKISLTIVGKGNLNKWGGKVIPQIFIENIEINKISDIDF